MLREGGTNAGTRLGCPRPPRGLRPPPPVRRARGQGKAPPPPLKMEVMKRAPPARPPATWPGRVLGLRPRHRRAATHPQTGSPGWRSSGTWTAASWRPAQPRPNHINRGGGGSSGSDYRRRVRRENAAYRARRRARLPVAGSSLARSTARNRRRGPSPHNTPT